MFSVSKFILPELRLVWKYPFSKSAKSVVSRYNLTFEDIDESILHKAQAIIRATFEGRERKTIIEDNKEVLLSEILAFTVSKILVSLINRLELNRKFVKLYESSILNNLEEEDENNLFEIADELNICRGTEKNFSVPLQDYLRPEIEDQNEKLVNKKIRGGTVFLDRAEFMKLISKIAAHELKNSLVSIGAGRKDFPANLKKSAEFLDLEFAQTARAQFSKSDFGAIAPEAFPPCMAKIYSELLNGVNVTHSGRFAIATFLASIGMPAQKITDSFRRTPNFNESITRYQVERIAGEKGEKYSCPSCDKMRSYQLCVANCPVSHPIQFYGVELTKGKKPISLIPPDKVS